MASPRDMFSLFASSVGVTSGFSRRICSRVYALWLGYITAAVRKAGHEVCCLNCNQYPEPPGQLVERTIRQFQPDVCATGALSPYLPQVQAYRDRYGV